MTDYGIKISKPGYDVEIATAEQSIFGSQWNTLNILSEGAHSITTDGSGQGSKNVAHNLSYKPAFLLFSYKATTDTVVGVSYNNAVFQASSGFFHRFFQNQINGWNHGIMCKSDNSNVKIKLGNAPNKTFYTYLFTFIDLAEETSYEPPSTDNDYGFRISQPGYDVKSDPDYRMIYSSKYKAFHILKTGIITVSAPEVTLGDGEENLIKTEITKSSIGVPDDYQVYLFMAQNKSLYTGNPINGTYFLSDGYFPLTGLYFFSAVDTFFANYNLFTTNDRIIAYIWRSYYKFFEWDPPSLTYPAVNIIFRYIIFRETMSF